jgi:hypothetical protein
MSVGLLFWVLWVVWLVFNLAVGGGYVAHEYGLIGGTILYAVLFGLLGWQVFGPVVHK